MMRGFEAPTPDIRVKINDQDNGPTADQSVILGAMQGKHIYGGTVPKATKDHRRAANKVARKSRRTNRKH